MTTEHPVHLHHSFLLAAAENAESASQATHEEAKTSAPVSHQSKAEAETKGAAETYEIPEEIPNIYTLTTALVNKDSAHGEGNAEGPFFLNFCFTMLFAVIFITILRRALRKTSVDRPTRAQAAVESLFEGLYKFFGDIIGEHHAHKYAPFVASMWLFIFLNNIFGLVPFLKSPTGHLQTTGALGLCVFCYVNYQGIKAGGLKHYLWHLCGAPTDAVAWVFAPFLFVLELLGTLIKPVSLSLRLFGNIMGEDRLLATFLGLGMMITALLLHTPRPLIGVPLHLPFFFLATLTSVVQATVFAMLSSVYISLLLPHDDHHGHEHAEGGSH